MHFSFLQVVAVVAALTRSMSACGKTSPGDLVCCGKYVFVRFASEIQPHDSPLRLVPDRKYRRVLQGKSSRS
ncbi:hypothetical protein EV424DRAFT_1442805 [Suillus variegatus]|nr:hypothetical protein EV424DRAFT_1442805 [Suillus variegatus]